MHLDIPLQDMQAIEHIKLSVRFGNPSSAIGHLSINAQGLWMELLSLVLWAENLPV